MNKARCSRLGSIGVLVLASSIAACGAATEPESQCGQCSPIYPDAAAFEAGLDASSLDGMKISIKKVYLESRLMPGIANNSVGVFIAHYDNAHGTTPASADIVRAKWIGPDWEYEFTTLPPSSGIVEPGESKTVEHVQDKASDHLLGSCGEADKLEVTWSVDGRLEVATAEARMGCTR